MSFIKKAFKYLFFILLSGAFILFVFSFAVKRTPENNYEDLNQTDKQLFDERTLQYKTFTEKPEQIWTAAYRYDKKPLILIRSVKNKAIWNYIYLVNASKLIDTSEYTKINFPGNPYLQDVYATTSLGTESLQYWFPAAFLYSTLGNQAVLAFKYYPELFKKGVTFPDFPFFSMHEAFHLYGQKDWTYDKDGKESTYPYPHTQEHFDLLRKEYKLLDSALHTTDTTALNTIMKSWVQIRGVRYKKWPQLTDETNSEAIEGTARYIELKYAGLTGSKRSITTNDNGQPFNFLTGLEGVLKDSTNYYFLERTASYSKGAALGYILDRLDPAWKEKITESPAHKGQTQYEILKSHY